MPVLDQAPSISAALLRSDLRFGAESANSDVSTFDALATLKVSGKRRPIALHLDRARFDSSDGIGSVTILHLDRLPDLDSKGRHIPIDINRWPDPGDGDLVR